MMQTNTRRKDEAFGKRVQKAMQNNPRIPDLNFGMFTWVRDQLREKHNIEITLETARKWYNGFTRPREDRLRALADILGVDPGWLAVGMIDVVDVSQKKRHAKTAHGAVNIVAGTLQLSGVSTAFPEPNDPNFDFVHFYSIVGGRHRMVYVTHGLRYKGDEYRFEIPNEFEQLNIIGVIMEDSVTPKFFHLDGNTISKWGRRKGGYIELSAERSPKSLVAKTSIMNELMDLTKAFPE